MKTDKNALMVRRKELVSRLEAIKRDLGGGLDKDYEEQAIQLENLEVLQEIHRVTQAEIRSIDQQLAKLDHDRDGD